MSEALSENYFSGEQAIADLVRTVPGLKDVQVFTDYDQALSRMVSNTPSAFVYYEGDDPVRNDVSSAGAAESVQNIFVVVVDKTDTRELTEAGHLQRCGPIVAYLRRLLPGQRVVPRSRPLVLHQGPTRRRLPKAGAIFYVFHLKLSAPIAPVATPH